MNKTDFVAQLRATAAELKPLIEPLDSHAMTWNGTEYVKSAVGRDDTKPEPYALAWYSILRTVAELIEAQETPISKQQIAYLDRTLFGGMGSLNDLSFDARVIGNIANTINAGLDKKRRALYDIFRGI